MNVIIKQCTHTQRKKKLCSNKHKNGSWNALLFIQYAKSAAYIRHIKYDCFEHNLEYSRKKCKSQHKTECKKCWESTFRSPVPPLPPLKQPWIQTQPQTQRKRMREKERERDGQKTNWKCWRKRTECFNEKICFKFHLWCLPFGRNYGGNLKPPNMENYANKNKVPDKIHTIEQNEQFNADKNRELGNSFSS